MTSSSNVTVNINVSPSPGFCIKSKLLQPGIFNSTQKPVPVTQGLKVFVNVAWSKDVPPPIDGVEKAVEFATHTHQVDLKSGQGSPIPVFTSDGRLDTDKAGKPALVFDCVYHSSLKEPGWKDAEFKSFLIELALQQIEAQNSLSLSRVLGTPNISSKGVLERRVVSVPATLFPPGHHYRALPDKTSTKKLIEEVADSSVAPSDVGLSSPGHTHSEDAVKPHDNSAPEIPTWTWRQEGREIRITIYVPKLTRAIISSSTLDLEPRRFILLIPDLYALDVDLDLSDASLEQTPFRVGADPQGTGNASMLKRARDLDIEGARAEWRVKDRCLVIVA
ncbi:PIH1 family [Lactifluus subvellereus]|nr:PIH1 family [Lactifluus subvellereus]